MRLLDLFSGAGGSAVGYHRAGFDVVGVDLHPQPNYPYELWTEDALDMLRGLAWNGLGRFDAIHASPPCQAYSTLRHAAEHKRDSYPDLIPETRRLLQATGLPYVIENVVGAPLVEPIELCGSMFGLGSGERQLRRHRLFESNVFMFQPECNHVGEAIGVYGGGPVGRYTFNNGAKRDYYGRRGGYQGTVAEKREAMQIDWMTASEINQAIPPAYCTFIGEQLRRHVEQRADDDRSACSSRAHTPGNGASPGHKTGSRPNTGDPGGSASSGHSRPTASEENAGCSPASDRGLDAPD